MIPQLEGTGIIPTWLQYTVERSDLNVVPTQLAAGKDDVGDI
jgi:hypothetical protein